MTTLDTPYVKDTAALLRLNQHTNKTHKEKTNQVSQIAGAASNPIRFKGRSNYLIAR